MKKEIEIEIVENGIYNGDDLSLVLFIKGDPNHSDYFLLTENHVVINLTTTWLSVLCIEYDNLSSYMEIPEIKTLHDKRFNKQVDLFGFLENEVYAMHFIERDGTTGFFDYTDVIERRKEIERLKANYNLFPSEETCVNAIPMSLDERKQYLFAIAKGYEVLTREEALENNMECFSMFFDSVEKNWAYNYDSINAIGNIHFKEEKHANECAEFMNESEDK